jgi:Putative zinc-finger
VADFTQFGSKKPGGPGGQGSSGNSKACVDCESMLLDALDGTLSAADQAAFDLHLVGCPACAAMLAEAQRGAAWMEMLKSPRPEPPAALLDRILAQTSGKHTMENGVAKPVTTLAANDYLRTPAPPVPNTLLGRPTLVPSSRQPVFTNVLPFRTRVSHGFRSLGQTMLQPRLAMTAAMAFFSIALTMNLTGVRLSQLRASDLKPSNIVRSYHSATAKVISYSYNLRVVYELESRVRDLQRSSDDDGSNGSSTTPAPQNAPAAQPGQQPNGNQQPGNQKQGPDKPNQKQTKPDPGSSRREVPGGSIRLAEFVQSPASAPFATKSFVAFTPSVFKQEGGLV